MKSRLHVVPLLATALLATGLAGCNAPAVDRAAELQRFQDTIHQRATALDLKTGAVLTSQQCEEAALKNNLDLAVRRLALRLQDDQVRLALSSGMPHLNTGYSFSRRSNSSAASLGTMEFEMQDRTQQSYALSATVPVLDFGLTYYAWQIAKDQRSQQELLFGRARQELRRDVRIAYARHAGAMRQVKLSVINVKAAEAVLKVGQTMEREALATHAEVAVLQAALAETQVILTVAQRKVLETRLELMHLMALPPDADILIDETLPALPEPPDGPVLAGFEEHALTARPELKVQDLQRHISANTVRREVAGFFPRIDANGSFNWSNSSMAVNPAFFLYGFSIADSLLDGGSQLWRYGLAEKSRTVEEERTLLLSLAVLYDVDMRALQLQRDHETIRALQATEDARQKAFNEILSLYKAGLETEAGTAKALADLNIQSLGVDRARTDYLVTWYQFQDATLAEDRTSATAPATMPAATTQPAIQPEKGKQP